MLIPVRHQTGGYDIVLENGMLKRVGEYLDLERKVLVVTDSGVPAVYADTVAAACKNAVKVCFPAGEKSKNIGQFEALLSVMLQNGFSRKDCVVAVGGGVVGDISGFAASCYMRGIDFYNIPTTLLSQVDSSIGGKTAVDFDGVKNIVGAFYQPKRVLIDPETLLTLDRRQLHAGLAEAIKMAVTGDAKLFALIESSTDLFRDLPEIIRQALLIKKSIVEEDPQEMGLRKVLNFGHTIGHAVESRAEGEWLHGECVAAGMLPFSSSQVLERLIPVLKKYDLPTEIPFSAEQLLPYLIHDKKKTAKGIATVLSDVIGTYRFETLLPQEILSRLDGAK